MNEKGQVLVISIFLMLIVLSAGIIISSRFFNSLHNFAKSDNANKALYVAESLAERLLSKETSILQGYVQDNNCLQNCYVSFEDGSEAYANISVLGNSSDVYKFKSNQDSIVEINLEGYPSGSYLDLCWNEKSSITAMYVYLDSGSYKVENYAYNSVSSPYSSEFSMAYPDHSYANCFRVTTEYNPVSLRVKTLYESAYIYAIPEPSATLPVQGISIISNGRFLDSYKRISVVKRISTVPQEFDYVLYQRSLDTSLSK